MKPPEKIDLPYFAYGPFKPDEPAFYKIQDFVQTYEKFYPLGYMVVSDGLPMVDLYFDPVSIVRGFLLNFKKHKTEERAYEIISDYYPATSHTWETKTLNPSGVQFNIVVRQKPDDRNEYIEFYPPIENWSAKDDPLFSKAIRVIAANTKKFAKHPFDRDESGMFDWEGYYQLHMKYLLLWIVLERFMSLKIGFFVEHSPHGTMNIRQRFAAEYSPFSELCSKFIDERLKIAAFSNPDKYNLLREDDCFHSIEFFHQLRTNLIHRGKSAQTDGERLRKSFLFLYKIVKEMLTKEGLFRG